MKKFPILVWPGQYTAVARGSGTTPTGVAVVEPYNVQ